MMDRDRADFAFLMSSARAARAADVPCFAHLDQPVGIWTYIRIANDVISQVPSGALLDWGCGFGQMTYLLRRRGLVVTPFDVGTVDRGLPDIPLCRGLGVVRVQDPVALPFAAASFDAVLSCGVLEHVQEGLPRGDENASLRELARVLRPGGRLLIYQLPQRGAWQEALIRRYKLGYAHPRRYTAQEITGLLQQAGLRVVRLRRANLLPRNLTGMPAALRKAYGNLGRALVSLDGLLTPVPYLNRFAGVLEITAERQEGRG